MILVTGAGGKTGKAVVKALAARGQTVRALVRRKERAAAMMAMGAQEAVVGDMHDEEALRKAMEGAQAVYHICPNVSPDEVAIGRAAISAALAADVQHFVFHSVLHPQAEAMPHHWSKLRVEESLFESGLPFTILQPTAYMQNTLATWDDILNGEYVAPYPVETRLSLVDLNDVAEAASTVLTESGHAGATYELVGTPAMTQMEVAEVFCQQFGYPVRAKAMSVETWERQARMAGLGQYQVETLVKMFRYYERYGLCGSPNVLGWLLRRPPASFPVFVERMVREQARQ